MTSEKASGPTDSQGGKLASESLENQGLQEPEIEQAGNRHDLRFEEVNEVTWKLTDGRGSIAWSGDRSGGYRTTRAVAWLMGVGNGQWIVRYRNKASRPMKLNAAKKYAIEMVRGVRPGRVVADPIAELNQYAANEADLAERREEPVQRQPVDLMGGTLRGLVNPELRRAILATELGEESSSAPLQGDDYPLEYDENGYPELPACLDRRTRA
jgi:hypothetical protein